MDAFVISIDRPPILSRPYFLLKAADLAFQRSLQGLRQVQPEAFGLVLQRSSDSQVDGGFFFDGSVCVHLNDRVQNMRPVYAHTGRGATSAGERGRVLLFASGACHPRRKKSFLRLVRMAHPTPAFQFRRRAFHKLRQAFGVSCPRRWQITKSPVRPQIHGSAQDRGSGSSPAPIVPPRRVPPRVAHSSLGTLISVGEAGRRQ